MVFEASKGAMCGARPARSVKQHQLRPGSRITRRVATWDGEIIDLHTPTTSFITAAHAASRVASHTQTKALSTHFRMREREGRPSKRRILRTCAPGHRWLRHQQDSN